MLIPGIFLQEKYHDRKKFKLINFEREKGAIIWNWSLGSKFRDKKLDSERWMNFSWKSSRVSRIVVILMNSYNQKARYENGSNWKHSTCSRTTQHSRSSMPSKPSGSVWVCSLIFKMSKGHNNIYLTLKSHQVIVSQSQKYLAKDQERLKFAYYSMYVKF